MTLIESGECHCNCHTDPNIKHIMACCHKCPYCGKRFTPGFYHNHKEECKNKHKKLEIYFDNFLGFIINNTPPQDED